MKMPKPCKREGLKYFVYLILQPSTEKRDLYDADHGKKVLSMAPGLKRQIFFLSRYISFI